MWGLFKIIFLRIYPLPCSGSTTFSTCSADDFESLILRGGGLCLKNQPSPSDVIGIPECGNGLVEKGEQCDCGKPQVKYYIPDKTRCKKLQNLCMKYLTHHHIMKCMVIINKLCFKLHNVFMQAFLYLTTNKYDQCWVVKMYF